MRRFNISLAALFVAALSQAQSYSFEITVENIGPQPLSPLFFSASNSSFDIFGLGQTASLGIKNIAEGGDTTAMHAIASAAGSDVSAFGTLAGGPVMPGGMRMGSFSTDATHNYFSFASMLGMTNDGFIGEGVSSAGLNLFSGSNPQGFTVVISGMRAWDAGTELNTQDAADIGALGGSGNPADSNNLVRVHDSIIPNFGDSWSQLPDWELNTNLARITVTPVPEPASMMALGLGAVALLRRRRQSKK